jgi:hypothetical protein
MPELSYTNFQIWIYCGPIMSTGSVHWHFYTPNNSGIKQTRTSLHGHLSFNNELQSSSFNHCQGLFRNYLHFHYVGFTSSYEIDSGTLRPQKNWQDVIYRCRTCCDDAKLFNFITGLCIGSPPASLQNYLFIKGEKMHRHLILFSQGEQPTKGPWVVCSYSKLKDLLEPDSIPYTT